MVATTIARTYVSTIHVEPALAAAVAELARLARGTPDLDALGRIADAASRALDELAAALDQPVAVSGARVMPSARGAFFAGLVLAKALACFAVTGTTRDRAARFRITAHRLLDTVAPLVSPEHHVLRRELLGDELPVSERPVASA